jgi:hypothetical protein
MYANARVATETMSNLSDHVSLQIVVDSSGIARAGFGTPMILSHTAAWVERVRFYTDLPSVGQDFAQTSPEYLSARAIFGQDPHPPQIAIGRAANKPTQVYVIGVSAVANLQAYTINVVGQGVTATTATYTSDSSATNDEIVDGLVTALNAVVGKNFTAAATGSSGTHALTVTGNAAGNWFSLEVTNAALLSNKQTHADPGLAADLDAIQLEQPGWYALTTNFNSQAYVVAAAAWVQANTKIYIADVPETRAITVSYTTSGSGDTGEALRTSAYSRVAAAYHPSPAAMFAAGWLGSRLPFDPGSDDWKWAEVEGCPSVALTATHRTNLRARAMNTIETVAGRNITWEGTTSNADFIDVIRGIDWLTDDMAKAVLGTLIAAKKTPYTDNGIAMIETAMYGSLKRAVAMGILAGDPKPVVKIPSAATQRLAGNTATRLLNNVKFYATLAGSIHKVSIFGTVTE